MKRFISIILTGVFIGGIISSLAAAEEEKISLTAAASSVYSTSLHYRASNTVDGNYNTYWVGAYDASPWWVMFDAGEITQIERVKIFWYSSSYAPSDYDIQISNDSVNWENVFTGLEAVYSTDGETKEINREARYMRLYIKTAPHFGLLNEFEAYAKVDFTGTIRFQGMLKDAQGETLEGSFKLTFRLYDTDAGGAPLWEEVQYDIDIDKGRLDVELGSVVPFDVSFDTQYWMGVEVESDGEMTPRFKLTSVPYAFKSEE